MTSTAGSGHHYWSTEIARIAEGLQKRTDAEWENLVQAHQRRSAIQLVVFTAFMVEGYLNEIGSDVLGSKWQNRPWKGARPLDRWSSADKLNFIWRFAVWEAAKTRISLPYLSEACATESYWHWLRIIFIRNTLAHARPEKISGTYVSSQGSIQLIGFDTNADYTLLDKEELLKHCQACWDLCHKLYEQVSAAQPHAARLPPFLSLQHTESS